jgi:hypothetical protein
MIPMENVAQLRTEIQFICELLQEDPLLVFCCVMITNAAAQSGAMPLHAELTLLWWNITASPLRGCSDFLLQLCLIERRCASASLVIPRSSCRVEAHAVARPRESLLLVVQLFAVE